MNHCSYKLLLVTLLSWFILSACQPIAEPYSNSSSQGNPQADSTATESAIASDVTPLALPTEDSLSPYPGPEQVSIDATLTPTPDVCMNIGQLTTFEDPIAGYRVQYPAEASISVPPSNDNPDSGFLSVVITMQPQCYELCWGFSRIAIGVRNNPQMLAVSAFADELYADSLSRLTNEELQNYQSGNHAVTIAGFQAWRIDQDIILNQPRVLIPYRPDRILSIAISSNAHPMPPFDPPCNAMLKLFDDLLNHIEFFPVE